MNINKKIGIGSAVLCLLILAPGMYSAALPYVFKDVKDARAGIIRPGYSLVKDGYVLQENLSSSGDTSKDPSSPCYGSTGYCNPAEQAKLLKTLQKDTETAPPVAQKAPVAQIKPVVVESPKPAPVEEEELGSLIPKPSKFDIVGRTRFADASKLPGIEPPAGLHPGSLWKSDKNEIFGFFGDYWLSMSSKIIPHNSSSASELMDFDSCKAGSYKDMLVSLDIKGCN